MTVIPAIARKFLMKYQESPEVKWLLSPAIAVRCDLNSFFLILVFMLSTGVEKMRLFMVCMTKLLKGF